MNLENMIGHLRNIVFYKWLFHSIGLRTLIIKPLRIDNPCNISIGDRTYIGHYSWLMGNDKQEVSLRIGNCVQIGHYAHIIARENIKIEDNVLLADKVFISDCTHNYENISISIVNQGVHFLRPVVIGEGSWIGENVCICGASVGKHCVIGANSVVTSDILDYCVAVGSPARVVKKYNFNRKEWVKVKENR